MFKSLKFKIIVGIFITLISVVIALFIITPTKIEVTGNIHNTKEEVLNFVGFNENTSILNIMLHKVTRMEDLSYIAELNVEYRGLTEIYIKVYEKDIIGYIEYMGKYICLDGHGYIVDYTDTPDPNIPIIKGINVESFTITKPIKVSKKIVNSIDVLYRNKITFDIPINVVNFNYGQGNHISLYINKLCVKIGNIDNIEEKFETIKEVIKILDTNEEGILYLENSKDKIIYKKI